MSLQDREVVAVAEKYRADVPAEFLRELDSLAADLASGQEIVNVRAKGRRRVGREPSSGDIKSVIIDELWLLLCTNDPKYKKLRGKGDVIGTDVVHFIAGVVVASLGLASGMATGCVAFAVLACTRVGVAVFCRLNLPSADSASGSLRPASPARPGRRSRPSSDPTKSSV